MKIFYSAQSRGVLEALGRVNVKGFRELGHTLPESVLLRIFDFTMQKNCGCDLKLKVIGTL